LVGFISKRGVGDIKPWWLTLFFQKEKTLALQPKTICSLQEAARNYRLTDVKRSWRALSFWVVLYYRSGRGVGVHRSMILISDTRPFGSS